MNAETPACRGVLGDRAVRRVAPSFFQETEQPKLRRSSQDKARGCREGPNAEPSGCEVSGKQHAPRRRAHYSPISSNSRNLYCS